MKLFSWWESMEIHMTFVWGLKYNLVFQVIWIYPVIRDDEILRCLCAWLCGFTTSSMTGAGLRILISIHESSGSRVKCLCYMSQWKFDMWKMNIEFEWHLMIWEFVWHLMIWRNCMKLNDLCLLISNWNFIEFWFI